MLLLWICVGVGIDSQDTAARAGLSLARGSLVKGKDFGLK